MNPAARPECAATCRSVPQMAARTTRTMASCGCSTPGSATEVTLTWSGPVSMTAFTGPPRSWRTARRGEPLLDAGGGPAQVSQFLFGQRELDDLPDTGPAQPGGQAHVDALDAVAPVCEYRGGHDLTGITRHREHHPGGRGSRGHEGAALLEQAHHFGAGIPGAVNKLGHDRCRQQLGQRPAADPGLGQRNDHLVA